MEEALIKAVTSSLRYDPLSGHFVWLVNRGKARVGDIAGTSEKGGYVGIRIYGKRYKAHRLAWLVTHGKWPCECIDHINGNTADNRLSNLREASPSQNHQNRARATNNSSGHTGVYFDRSRNMWAVEIKANGTKFHVGRFTTVEEAARARAAAKRQVHTFHPVDPDRDAA